MLILLAGGIYFTLARVLYRNLDDSIRNRAEQISRFRDIISIVAEGTFEEEIGEFITFYYYSKGHLTHISHKNDQIHVDRGLIDLALSGKSAFSAIEDNRIGKLRVFAMHFFPDNSPRVREGSARPPDARYPGPERFNRSPDDRPRRPGKNVRPEIADIREAVLIIARPTRDIETTLDRLFQILLVTIPLTILLAGGGGVFLARRAFRPVDQITEMARQIEEKDLSRRINVKSKDELGRLASTLNQMIERLESAFKRQRQFTSDASHELRAPLAVIQAESTLTLQRVRKEDEYRRSLERISQESEHMSAVINQLLRLARADAGKEQIRFEVLDLTEFIQEVYADVEVLCYEKGIELHLAIQDGMKIKGDRKSLKRLMHNLLDNAVKYTAREGSIYITVQRKEETAVISITDTGIGIPSDELHLIFERFYRVDKARSRAEKGSGLGLAICKHIMDIHGGSLEVESRPGKGTTFHAGFPELL